MGDVMQRAAVASAGRGPLDALRFWVARTRLRLSPAARLELYEQFQTFTDAKFPLDKVLERMLQTAREDRDDMALVYDELLRKYRGSTHRFHDVLADFIPPAERVMVAVGEDTGDIPKGYEEAAFVCTVVARMRGALFGALSYPVGLMLFILAIMVFLAAELAPSLEAMLDRPIDQWPALSRYLFMTDQIVREQGVFILAGAVALFSLVGWSLSRWTGRIRAVFDQWVPPYNIYREYQGSVFVMALGALLRAGRPLESAVIEMSRIASPWLRGHLTRVAQSLMATSSAGVAIDTGLLGRSTVRYLRNFDAFNAFEKGLDVMGRRGVDRAIGNVALQAKSLRLIVYIVVAVAILVVYGGALAPGKMIYEESRMGTMR
jgi:toxin coregulated pilus biosynthesis protein E